METEEQTDAEPTRSTRAREILELVRELAALGAAEVEVDGVRVRFNRSRVPETVEAEATPERNEEAKPADEKAAAAAEDDLTYWSA